MDHRNDKANNSDQTKTDLEDKSNICDKLNNNNNNNSVFNSSETSPIMETGRRTRLSKKVCLESLAQKNKAHRAKIQNIAKASTSYSASVVKVETPASQMTPIANSQASLGVAAAKRKNGETDARAKRKRNTYQPFQSPNLTSTPLPSNSTKAPKSNPDKLVIYTTGTYLAVRNEENSFFLCRARQNICMNERRIKIIWYTNQHTKRSSEYCADYEDVMDFECILTNVRVNKCDSKRVSLPDSERQRVMNILERAINVEKGINPPPDPTKVISDGLDISIIGKAEEDELLRKFEANDKRKCANGKKSNGKIVAKVTNGAVLENGAPSASHESQSVKVKKEPKDSVKPIASSSNKTTDKAAAIIADIVDVKPAKVPTTPRSRTRKISPTTSDDLKTANSNKLEITAYKFDDNSRLASNESSIGEQSDEKDVMFDSKTEFPFISAYVNSKLLIRAVLQNDQEQLKHLLKNELKHVCSVAIPRSVCIKKNAIHYSIENEDFISLNRLLNVCKQDLTDNSFHIESMELLHSELLLDQKSYQSNLVVEQLDSSYAKFALKNNTSMDFILKTQSYFKNALSDFTSQLLVALKHGNFELASFLAGQLCAQKSDVFNQSHLFLLANDSTGELDIQTIEEFSLPAHKVTPLHIAAINPDPFFFSSIVNNLLNKLYYVDNEQWMPIHYASVCSTFFNLQYLLNLGVSTLSVDSKGNTPLHLATACDRLENVALILSTELAHSSHSSVSLKAFNQKGWTPLHVACKKGFINIVKFFIENNAEIDIATSNNSGELTPLMIACQYGHIKIVKTLINSGANINLFDKKNRCPLTHAVMNGHTNIVNYLLNYGANPSCKDMFGNNLFHYALAYGWYYCYETILKTNVNLKDTNMFGLTPICAAFMKGHIGIIDDILRRNILSVNVPINDSGITLIKLAFSLYPNEILIANIRLFIERFKCDLAKTDYNGNNTLHYLLQCESKYKTYNSPSITRTLNKALTILDGCDPFAVNTAGISPIEFALKNDCFVSFLHFFKEHHTDSRFQKIIAGSEHFFPLIISHLLERTESEDGFLITVSRFLMDICNENESLQPLLKDLAMKANKHGDVAIQFFLKSTKQIILHADKLKFSQEILDSELIEFVDFLLRFYELKFLQDIFLLHIAAKYSIPAIVRHLSVKFFNMEGLDELNYTPLGIALLNGNHATARTLIECGANTSSKIRDLSCFMFHLTNNHNKSYEFAKFLCKFAADVNETDSSHNSALHLICSYANQEFACDVVQILVDKGIDVNLQNNHGQTALHIALQSNKITPQLCHLFEILMKAGANLYLKDCKGKIALNYLFKAHNTDEGLINILQMIDNTQLNSFVDNNGANLLWHCAAVGDSVCLSYLKSYVDVNKLDHNGRSPFAIAAINNHKDCALILLQSECDILHNFEYFVEQQADKRANIFTQLENNGWKDVLFEILEKAKNSNRLLDFVHNLIKYQCIEFAILALKVMKTHLSMEQENWKCLLKEFSQSCTHEIGKILQITFLKQFGPEIIRELLVELFLNSLTNWNYILADELLKITNVGKIVSSMHQEKKSSNLISLVFLRMFQQEHFPDRIKELVISFLHEDININSLSVYPISESGQAWHRYSLCKDRNDKTSVTSLVQYSPLIVAVIKGDYGVVKWLLSIKHKNKFVVNLNFTDSNQRTPIMHAILNNDLKMVKLLLDRSYCFEDDTDCWNSDKTVWRNQNDVDLLARDKNKLTLFHYLILPFDYFNYAKADLLFNLLWPLVDANYRTADFISELHKLASDNHVSSITSALERIDARRTVTPVSFPNKKNGVSQKKFAYNFPSDHESLMNHCSRAQKNPSICNRHALIDEVYKLPYDVTFTKLDSQKGHYIYNFYKIQILTIGNQFIVNTRWGRVGTVGNLKRVFFSTKQEAVEEFKRIFYIKSGNEWSNVGEPVPNQDKYRIVDTKRNMKLTGFDLDLNMQQLTTIKSQLAIDLRDIIIRWIKCQAKNVEFTRSFNHNNLNSLLLDNCDEILQKIYPHIFKQKVSLNRNKKCSLKYMSDIIDLSEEFYNQIGIYGKEFDQLNPILSLDDFYEKSKHVHRLKSIVFAKELLFCAQKVPELNPVDYIYDSFRYELENVLTDSEEYKFVHLFLQNSAQFKFTTVSFYRVKLQTEQFESSRNSHLLWHPLEDAAIFRTFVKGLQLAPLHDPNSHLIFKGIKLTNKLVNESSEADNLNYLLLCEAKLDQVLKVGPNEAIDHSLFEHKNAIAFQPSANTTTEYLQHYLSWRGTIVPFSSTKHVGPSEFVMLNSNHVIPRYLIEYRKV